MSLVSLPNVEKIPKADNNVLAIMNGIMIQPILECENLNDIEYTERRPEKFKSNFAVVATFLANTEDIRLVYDKRLKQNMWWAFMRSNGKLYMHNHAKHDRPTYFS